MSWAAAYIACIITGLVGVWVGGRTERRKHSYTESWLCPNERCGFSVSANDAKAVERVRIKHQVHCTGRKKVN